MNIKLTRPKTLSIVSSSSAMINVPAGQYVNVKRIANPYPDKEKNIAPGKRNDDWFVFQFNDQTVGASVTAWQGWFSRKEECGVIIIYEPGDK